MKKASMFLLCVMVLLTILVVLRLPQKSRQPSSSSAADTITSSNFTSITPSSQENSAMIAAASRQDQVLYVVKEYKGHIGIYREGDKLPFKEIDVDVSVFPETDRKLLKNGIKAKGTAELTRVIEDYEG